VENKTLIITGAHVVDPSRKLDAPGHLVVRGGEIVACDAGDLPEEYRKVEGAITRKGAGLTIVPGLFDLRAHLREPGYEDRETIATGSAAAAAGGFTDVVTMPNTQPCADSPGAIELVKARGALAGRARLHPVAALTKGMEGKSMVEYGDMHDAGAVAFSDDLNWVRDSGLMRHAMESVRMLGVPVISHPEDTTLAPNGTMHEGTWSTRLGLYGLPAAAEVSAIARDIELARLTGAHLHIPHVSSRDGVALIRNAKREGLRVTCETTPHHVFFTDADCRDYDTSFKVKPPLRATADQEALIEALADGTIDAIATDHAPHTDTDKDRSFAHAPFGAIGLETAFAAAHDRLVVRGPLSLWRLVELMSTAPARILGHDAGSLAPGRSADFALIDAKDMWTPHAGQLLSKGRNCPWIGRTLTGRVHATWLAGERTFDREMPVATGGHV